MSLLLLRLPLALFVLLFLGIGLAAQWGDRDPRADLLLQFFPVWASGGLIAGGLLGLASWAHRRSRYLAIGLGVLQLALVAITAAPEVLRDKGRHPGPADTQQVRVVSLNAWADNRDPATTLAWIESEDPDVVVLVEAIGDGHPIARTLRKKYRNWTSCDYPRFCSSLIYARWPIRTRIALQASQDRFQPVAAVLATIEAPDGAFDVMGLHMIRPTHLQAYRAQARVLSQAMSGTDRHAAIVAGDFNAAPWSHALQMIDRELGVIRRTGGQPTWPSWLDLSPGNLREVPPAILRPLPSAKPLPWPLPFLAIDHIYAGRAWASTTVRVSPRLGSDHRGLVVDLARPKLVETSSACNTSDISQPEC